MEGVKRVRKVNRNHHNLETLFGREMYQADAKKKRDMEQIIDDILSERMTSIASRKSSRGKHGEAAFKKQKKRGPRRRSKRSGWRA